MTISKFIREDEKLKKMDFATVFHTIYYLYEKGLLKKDAFGDE